MMVEQVKDSSDTQTHHVGSTNLDTTASQHSHDPILIISESEKNQNQMIATGVPNTILENGNGIPKETAKSAAETSELSTIASANDFLKQIGKDFKLEKMENVSAEVAHVAPLLVGRYYLKDEKAFWSGRWGMNEAAFDENGVTSPFEMCSETKVNFLTHSGDNKTIHPSMNDVLLAHSNLTNQIFRPETVSPVFFGYEVEPEKRSQMPFDGAYGGFFQIQANKNKPQTVSESNVIIRFVHDLNSPDRFVVTGSGENRFGRFSLHGSLHKQTNILQMYKIYKPKEKEKKGFARRGRTPRAAAQAGLAKLQNRPTLTVIPPSTPVTFPTSSSRRTSRSQSYFSNSSIHSNNSTPNASTDTLTFRMDSPSVRNRSSRKRVVPAYLREENILDQDKASAMLRKCHSILKSLMANSKASPFLSPVDPIALGIPDYFKVIKEPMDLGTIRQNLEAGAYEDASIFVDHVRLVFSNAMLYNAAHSQVHIFAQKLMEDFDRRVKIANLKFYAIPKPMSTKRSEDKLKIKQSSKKIRGGRGAKGNSKRGASNEDQGLINSLREDIERLKATLEQLQPGNSRANTPRLSRAASRPFKMEDLTEEELNKPMSKWEITKLSADIKLLPQNKISRVLQIISEAVPVSNLVNENDEIELDFESFDTRCLRMLEGYVKESDVSRKRKRPMKKTKVAPPENRLKSAKLAEMNIRNRQMELRNELAQIEGLKKNAEKEMNGDAMAVNMATKAVPTSSDDSSSTSSSDSSDSDSESESENNGSRQSLAEGKSHAAALSSNCARKFSDQALNDTLVVENKGAWSMLAKKETLQHSSISASEQSPSSSLWLSARSMEQRKQQKLKQEETERNEVAQAQRDIQQREQEKIKERERQLLEYERKQKENAYNVIPIPAPETHLTLESSISVQIPNDDVLTEDFESFSASTFL